MTPAPPPLLRTYHPPTVRPGSRAYCHMRRAWCKVTGWTDAPIPLPLGYSVGVNGGRSVVVTRELVRAIRTESADALLHWFGVSSFTATAWRKAFGVAGMVGTEGTRRAVSAGSVVGGGAADAARVRSDAERAAHSARAKRLGSRPGPRWTPGNGGWTPDEDAILGTVTDAEAADRTGRTRAAVRQRRQKLGRGAVVRRSGGVYVVRPAPRPQTPGPT